MSDEIFNIYIINGIVIIINCLYFVFNNNENNNIKREQIDYLCEKVCTLEKRILNLEETIEEIEDKILSKINKKINRTQKQDKSLEEFIDYDYELIE